jgi:hypothetical protein
MSQRILTVVTALLLVGPLAAQDATNTVKVEKAEPPKELKEGFAALLSDQSVQVADDKGMVWATFWFRKAIPCKAAPEQVKNGLTYREIPQTTVIGVVQFAQPWTDFRKQKIPAGVYTLRQAIQPMDGDHQGTAPTSDFCLLVPAAKDEKPDTMDVKAMQELSANAPGGTHPGVMLIFANDKPEDAPKLSTKPNKITVVSVKLPVDAAGTATTLGYSFAVVGTTTQE